MNSKQTPRDRRALHHAIQSRRRAGIAAIEFLMYLPVLAAFIAVTLWVVGAHQAILRSSHDAETAALEAAVRAVEQRRLPQTGQLTNPSTVELAQLLRGFDPAQTLTQGVVEGVGSHDTGPGVQGHVQPLGNADDSHQLMAHSWESDVFAFPPSKSAQRPLTFPSAIRGVVPGFSDLGIFLRMLQFSGALSGMASSFPGQFLNRIQQAAKTVEQGISQVQAEISNLQQRIQAELSRANPNTSLIDQLKRALQEKLDQEAKLKEGRQHARDAARAVN